VRRQDGLIYGSYRALSISKGWLFPAEK